MTTNETSPQRSLADQVFRGFYAVIATFAVCLIIGVIALAIGLLQGYRPVVLTSGSMSPTAPTGSVLIAHPVDEVRVGDILVMANEARATVTHRVVELETAENGQLFAITRGDANEEIDAAPYAIDGRELVGRWVIPGLGSALLWLGSPLIGLVVVGGAVLTLTMSALSYIWGSGREERSGDGTREHDNHELPSHDQAEAESVGRPLVGAAGTPGQKRFALGVALSILFGFTGLAWSLYLSTDTVAGNVFGTSDCFDARVDSVQTGAVTSSSNGVTSVGIAAVDPASSFVLWSVRSGVTKPGDTVVVADLSSPTTVDFVRQTDSGTPTPIVIEWSVVEYGCGVTVQRGLGAGNGADTLDFPVASVDPSSSFVVGATLPSSADVAFDQDDQAIVELVGSDTVRFRSTPGGSLGAQRAYGYQLVTFDDGGDAATQVVSTTLGAGTATDLVTLASPVDPDSTMVFASATSVNSGAGVGDRMVRVRLVDSNTVEVVRSLTAGSVEVNVQVVEMNEGTTVRRGVVTLAPAEATAAVGIDAVDPTRTTVGSTVLVGGASGGATDEGSSGEPGEGLATARLRDAVTVDVERAASDSTASFAWQAVTWGGPQWGDPNSPYRQRIDVDAGAVDVPDGYTTPVVIDHAALVSSGLSMASGDDVRLWRFDGTTWTEIDRVLDETSSWNSSSTTFWFRTRESIAASSTISYWMYFGDQSPPPPLADPAEVWLLTEGFEGGLGSFEDRTEGTAWYTADPWTRRIDFVVDAGAIASPLVDTPVLVSVTDADLAANAQSDGSDIVFTDGGSTVLPHDIESWDSAIGSLVAWVTVPILDDTANTTLSLLYGAPNAPDRADQRGTWDGQGIVWNMTGDPTGPAPSLDDRGSRNVDGVALADASLSATNTGFAAALDGATDRLESEPLTVPDSALTVSAWFRADAITGDAVLVAQGDPTAGGVFELAIDNTTNPGSPTLRGRLNVDGAPLEANGGSIVPGAWHHVAMVWDQVTLTVVVDGANVDTVPAGGPLPSPRTSAVVLGGDSTGARTLAGALGQARIRFEAVSAANLAFEAANLIDPLGSVVGTAPVGGTYLTQGTWTERRPLTVSADLADVDLTDFVLLVQVVDADLGSSTQADGGDLVFTAEDGVSRLDHYVESWNGATGALTAWVRIPLLSSSVDTEIFLYSGNPAAVDQTDPVGVWGIDADLVLPAP